MKLPDYKSTLAAVILGAVIFALIQKYEKDMPVKKAAVYGALIGLGVQIGVRFLGVS